MAASKDAVAQYIVGACLKRGYSHDKTLAVLSALYQESGFDETIWDPTHVTYGVAQQDGSYPNRFDGYHAQVDAFLDRFDVQCAKPGASPDVWLNICWLQQAPNWPSAQYWLENGRTAYEDEIKSRIDTVTPYLDKYWSAVRQRSLPWLTASVRRSTSSPSGLRTASPARGRPRWCCCSTLRSRSWLRPRTTPRSGWVTSALTRPRRFPTTWPSRRLRTAA